MSTAFDKKTNRDNHANQLNPNHSAYASSRSGKQRDDDEVQDGDFDKLCDSDDD